MRSYQKALTYLDSFLNFEQIPRPEARLWNLKRIRRLLEIFSHPDKGIFTILIGGTKGKGSTGFFLSEILRHSGLKVGFYHSPHLEGPRERIWVNGRPVSKKEFACGMRVIQRKLVNRPTYFEIMTLLAVLLFKQRKVDVALYEVGMGGRLDATNTLPARLVILTPIHFDHEAWLGNTLTRIAREKAAILRRNQDAVIAPQVPEVREVIRTVARRRHSSLWPPLNLNHAAPRRMGLLGDFQRQNAAVALRAAQLLRDRFHFKIPQEALSKGLQSRCWPGRMELFRGSPSFLLDGAHNPRSIGALARNVRQLFPRRRKILIFGTSRDKRSDRMLSALASVFDTCIPTQSKSPRAKPVLQLLKEAQGLFHVLIPKASAKEALHEARRLARPEDLVVATGSFYLIGELRPLCRRSNLMTR